MEWETSASPCTETARVSDGFLLGGVAYYGFEVRCVRKERCRASREGDLEVRYVLLEGCSMVEVR